MKRSFFPALVLWGICLASPGAEMPPGDDAWRKEKEEMWDRLWKEGKTIDEIEAEITRAEKEKERESRPLPPSLPPPRKGVDPQLADDIEKMIPADYKGQAGKFRGKWEAAARSGDTGSLQDYVLASIVHFTPTPEVEADWLARAGLDEKALVAWIRSQIRCPVLQAASEGKEPARAARSHLDSDLEACPRCAGSKRRLLAAYVDSLIRLTDPERGR